MMSCGGKSENPNAHLEMSYYDSLRNEEWNLNPEKLHDELGRLVKSSTKQMKADRKAIDYYQAHGELLWVNRQGVSSQADSLLASLRLVGEMGLNADEFFVAQIERDLNRMRQFTFSESHPICKVAARLELNLTKAFLRLTAGQRFGFVNPSNVFNKLDPVEGDTTGKRFKTLFGIPMQHAGEEFFSKALRMIKNDSVVPFLHECKPQDSLFYQLQHRLQQGTASQVERKVLLCNMERCRWRFYERPADYRKYVMVNIANFRLEAVGGSEPLTMKVGCGTTRTKTPLLTSKINLIQLNPVWVMPKSIVEKDIVRHLGDDDYFERNNYYVYEVSTGRHIDLEEVTADMLHSGKYKVAQQGGAGNALGRIIFRFPNDFSVYLHHTSSPGFFRRDDRGVSHGCVRVEHPFELAKFLLADKDEEFLERVHYSITADLEAEDLERSKLLRSVEVSPPVPLFITYYTAYPDTNGQLQYYKDVYGYDDVLFEHLAWITK
jgi:murein L,D-transpeptidase YcbB/YkuD